MKIPVSKVLPNPEQPRKDFDQESLESLAGSIKEVGLIHAITVEKAGDDYILLDGERRWRACQLIGLKEIEAEIRPVQNNDRSEERLKLAMIANLQRKDMNPIEEAVAYERLRKMGHSFEEIAKFVGVNHQTIRFRVSLLKLEPEVQELLGKRLIPLDPGALPLILQLPKEIQVKLCKKFAVNRTPAGYIRGVCRRYLNNSDHQYGGGTNRSKKSGIPMFDMAEASKSRDYDIFEASGGLPKWEKLTEAAKEACEACSLSEVASMAMCKECPAVDLLKRLTKKL